MKTNEEIVEKAERDIEFVVSNPDLYTDVSVQVKDIIRTTLEAKDKAHQEELEKAVEAARKEDAQRVIEWLYDRELPLPLYLVQILGGVTFPTKTDKQTEV